MGFYNDTFTAANGTLATAHTSDNGESYSGGSGFKIHDGRLYCDNVSNAYLQPSGVTTATGDKINLYMRKVTDAGNFGIIVGDSTGGQSGYLLRVRSGNLIELWQIVLGSFSQVQDGGQPVQHDFTGMADGTDFKITYEFNSESGTTSKIYLDDVLVIDVETLVPAVNGNLFIRQNQVSSTTTGYHLDKIEYIGSTPPYPVEVYPVDTTASDSGHLQHHTADSGQLYDMNKGARLANGRLYFDDGLTGRDESFIRVVDAVCDTEYNIDIDVHRLTDAGNVGVAFGMPDNFDGGWHLRVANGNKVQLWETDGPNPTPHIFINEYITSTTDGTDFPAIQAQVRSGQIEVFVGGVSRFTHSTAVSKEGKLYLRGNVGVTDTTGIHMNSVTYTAVTNGAGGPLVYNDTFTVDAPAQDAGTLTINDFVVTTSSTVMRREGKVVFRCTDLTTVPTTGNTAVSSGGQALTIDDIKDLGSNVYDIYCIVPDTTTLINDNVTGYSWTINVDGKVGLSAYVPFLPRAGWDYVTLNTPTTTTSLLTGYSAVVAVTGDQLEYNKFSYPEGLTYSAVNADSTYTLSASPFLELNLDRRVVQANGTVAAVETINQGVTLTATVNDDVSLDNSPMITGTCNVNHSTIEVTADPGTGNETFTVGSLAGTWSVETAPHEVSSQVLIASGTGTNPAKTYMIDPNLIRLASGEILLVYSADSTHDQGLSDVAYGRIYDDTMTEVVSEFVIHDNPTVVADNGGPRGVQGGVLDSGRVVLFWIIKDASTNPHTYLRCETIYSDDDGRTWSSVQQIQSIFPSETTGYIPFSRTMKTSYSTPYMQEFDHIGFCYMAYSSDGITWGDLVTVYNKGKGVDGYDFGEFSLCKIDDDRFVLTARSQLQPSVYGYWKTYDAGRTWSANPTVVTQTDTAPTTPAPINFQTIGDRVLIAWGSRNPVYRLYTKWMDKEEFFHDPGLAWGNDTGLSYVFSVALGDPLVTFNFGYPDILPMLSNDYTAHLVWYDQAEASPSNTSTTDIRYMTFPRPR